MKKYKLKIKNAKLKTTAEFNELYKEVYKNFIIELEKERKKNMVTILVNNNKYNFSVFFI